MGNELEKERKDDLNSPSQITPRKSNPLSLSSSPYFFKNTPKSPEEKIMECIKMKENFYIIDTVVRLNLNDNSDKFGPIGAHLLSIALVNNITLKSLYLGKNKIGKEGMHSLSLALKSNSTLTKLNLDENNIGDEGTKELSDALKINYSLKNLSLYRNNIGDEGMKELSFALEKTTTLNMLNLGGNSIGCRGASALCSSLEKNATLTDLKLYKNLIDNSCVIKLSPFLKTNSTLSFLDLSYNKIGAEGAHALSLAIATNVKLLQLDLGYNVIGDDGITLFSQALKTNNTLTMLDLRNNNIGNDGVKELSIALNFNNTLVQLLLDSNKIGDSGVIELSSSIREIEKLNLGDNNIGVKGVNALSTSLKNNSKLIDLNLQHNKLGSEGVKELSTLFPSNTTLTSLNISGNDIGQEVTRAIETSLNTNKLRKSSVLPVQPKEHAQLYDLHVMEGDLTITKEQKEAEKKEKEKKEVKEWFQTIDLTPELLQEEYANCFIREDLNNLQVISSMTKNDLSKMNTKLNISVGNYRKLCVAIKKLKPKVHKPKVFPKSSHVHPWHIDPFVQNLETWIKENNTLSLLPLPLDSLDPSLQFTFSQYKSIFENLKGSLDDLKSVYLSYTSNLENMFQSSLDAHLGSLIDSPNLFKDQRWRKGIQAGVPWREVINNKFFKYALQFPNNFERDDGLVVIPVVTGYKDKDTAMKVCNNGPKVVGAADEGYFGRGIYFTTNINYAKKFGKFLVVYWVFIGNLYPAIEFPHPPVGSPEFYDKLPNYQKPTLCGKPQMNDKIFVRCEKNTVTYDTHYTIVRPFTDEGAPPTTMKYVPCEVEKMDNDNVFDEVVVFQESHVLPMYLIELL